jgi:hypothetical protein
MRITNFPEGQLIFYLNETYHSSHVRLIRRSLNEDKAKTFFIYYTDLNLYIISNEGGEDDYCLQPDHIVP